MPAAIQYGLSQCLWAWSKLNCFDSAISKSRLFLTLYVVNNVLSSAKENAFLANENWLKISTFYLSGVTLNWLLINVRAALRNWTHLAGMKVSQHKNWRWMGWRDDSEVKRTHCCSRGSKFKTATTWWLTPIYNEIWCPEHYIHNK